MPASALVDADELVGGLKLGRVATPARVTVIVALSFETISRNVWLFIA